MASKMTKETIYYNRMFGYKDINYTLSTKTVKTTEGKIITHYYADFGNNRIEIGKEEYDCLLEELKNEN